jgi:hydrogenase/urease accessory protein HupE
MRPITHPVFFAALLFSATAAKAHELVPGVTGFPGEMLHPLLIPEFAASFIACTLLAGSAAKERFLILVAVFVAGMVAGKGLLMIAPVLRQFWYAPAIFTLLAGLTVAALRPVPFVAALILILALAFFVSVGLLPEQPGMAGMVRSVTAYSLTGTILLGALGYPLIFVNSQWGGILVRVAGAWLAAVSMLYLAYAWRITSGPLPSS